MIAEQQQWHLLIQVVHGPEFGHKITMQEKSRGRDPWPKKSIGSWRGLGIPEPVLTSALASISSLITEHLVTRYGVSGELPLKWAGEPEPF